MRATTIHILAARFWPDAHGGVETHLLNMARSLAALGVDVRVITENRTNAAATERLDGRLEIRRIDPLDCGRLWRVSELMRVRWWRRAIAEHAGAGVIWASDPLMATAAILGGRGADLVFNPACCAAAMHHVGARYPQVTTMKMRRMQRWLDRFAYRHARRVVVASENLRQQARRWYGVTDRVRVVPLGVQSAGTPRIARDEARRKLGLGPEAFVAGFVGRLDPCKDLPFLFEATADGSLGAEGRLLIVGDGPDRARLHAIASQRGVADRIVWTGSMADPSIAYAAINVAVLPSVYEAFGNVILEAMAAGVPVIGRDRCEDADRPVLTASAELIDDGRTGRVIAPHDVRALAGALREMREDPRAAAAMGARARAAASQRSWARMARAYLDVLGSGPGGACSPQPIRQKPEPDPIRTGTMA